MKKFLKTLVVGLCLFTLLCCALPAAFAADKTSGSKKEENVYAIGMDAQGGICSTVVTYTNLSGKLESTPEQPTMTGYTFDGWYTEPVGGSKVTTSTVFTSDATIYAHWTAKVASWAAVMGRARDKIFLEMLPLEKSLLFSPTRAASLVLRLMTYSLTRIL